MRWTPTVLLIAHLIGCMDNSVTVGDDRPPEVAILSPIDQSVSLEGQALTLEGTVADDESSLANMEIYWSSNLAGRFSQELLVDGQAVSLSLPEGLAVGEHLIELVAIDGAGGSAADSVTLQIEANTAPEVVLISPEDGETLAGVSSHTLVASVSDAHDAVEDLVLLWESSIDGELQGTEEIFGTTVTLAVDAGLSAGDHTLSLQAFDTLGAWGNDTLEVTVEGDENQPPTVSFTAPSPTDIYDFLDVVYIEAMITDDAGPLDTISLSWGGSTELEWMGGNLPENPTSAGTVSGSLVLDCVYYDSANPSTFQIVLTAQDAEGASGQATTTFESYCKPVE